MPRLITEEEYLSDSPISLSQPRAGIREISESEFNQDSTQTKAPSPRESWLDSHPWMKTVVDGYKGNIERTKGLAKEALSLGSRIPQLGANIGEVASDALDRARGLGPRNQSALSTVMEEAVERPEILTPQNDQQKQGAMVENIAEFAVPNPFKLAKAPAAISKTGKAIDFGIKVLSEGIEQGARGAIQKGSAKDLGTDTLIGGAIPVAGVVARGAGSVLSKVAKTISSKLSGVPTAAIEEAFKNPETVSKAIRKMAADPELGPQKVLNFAEESFDDLLKDRSSTYRSGLERVEKETMQTKGGQWYVKKFDQDLGKTLMVPIDFTLKGVKDTATKALKEFGAAAKGNSVDLTDVPLPSSYKKDLEEVVSKIYGWKKLSPMGMDDLRENLDVFYRRGAVPSPADTKFNSILTRIKKNLSDYTADRVPQIQEMNQQFGADSEAINLIRQELSLGKDKPGTVTKKLMNIFNPKSSTYLNILNKLGEQKANDLRADIAGLLMSKWTPEGLGSYLTTGIGTIGGAAAVANPATLPVTLAAGAASSPRIIGEVTTKASKLAKKIPKNAGETLSRAAKGAAAQLNK